MHTTELHIFDDRLLMYQEYACKIHLLRMRAIKLMLALYLTTKPISGSYGGREGSNSILHTQTFTQVQNLNIYTSTKPSTKPQHLHEYKTYLHEYKTYFKYKTYFFVRTMTSRPRHFSPAPLFAHAQRPASRTVYYKIS